MARKRFSKEEREIISTAGASGLVDWQNVTQWHPATLRTADIITGSDGWQHVIGVCQVTTRTIHKGEVVHISPGHIRSRSTDAKPK